MTLRSLRTGAGLSLDDVASHVAKETNRHYAPITAHLWEHRGIQRGDVLSALASLYGISLQEIMTAAAASAAGAGPKQQRGRKPKDLLQSVV